MRIVTLGLGGLLLLGGGVLVVLADQQRQGAVEQTEMHVRQLEESLERERATNTSRAEVLTELRSAIAEQEKKLADTEGFLQ